MYPFHSFLEFRMKLFSLVAVLVLMTSYFGSTSGHTKTFRNKYRENLRNSMSFKCKEPQPRVVPIEELHTTSSELTYLPHVTVLNRCGEDTGCCVQQAQVCSPVESQREAVELVFHAFNNFRDEQIKLVVHTYNDTRCACRHPEDHLFS